MARGSGIWVVCFLEPNPSPSPLFCALGALHTQGRGMWLQISTASHLSSQEAGRGPQYSPSFLQRKICSSLDPSLGLIGRDSLCWGQSIRRGGSVSLVSCVEPWSPHPRAKWSLGCRRKQRVLPDPSSASCSGTEFRGNENLSDICSIT